MTTYNLDVFFLIWNQSVVPCLVLTAASRPAYRFLKRQVRWSGSPPLSEFSTVCCNPHKGFGIVNKAEIDVFLELSCFLNDPVDIGNLTSGSSAFSKTNLNIWNFTVHILLKPGLEKCKPFSPPFLSQLNLSCRAGSSLGLSLQK